MSYVFLYLIGLAQVVKKVVTSNEIIQTVDTIGFVSVTVDKIIVTNT
ncbi:hypothetical protein [Fructilactobacillus sanfranciscensis]|nr:hypothetical protein [Fructilactobacillus sanfranciscensis]